MDKRIMKTKKALKDALFSLLQKKDFETIKTTEICEKALVSRNTFYNYYADKYALLEECFQDYEVIFQNHFEELQEKNNPGMDVQTGFLNLLETFFDTESLYDSIPIIPNFDLVELYYRAVSNILEKYEDKYAGYINSDYDLKQLNSFLILGFWGFIHGNRKLDTETVKESSRRFVLDLLDSPIFRLH